MNVLKAYATGLPVFLIVEVVSNFDSEQLKLNFSTNWWTMYIAFSYLIIFPIIYSQSKASKKKDAITSKKLNNSLNKANKTPMRLGSLYSNSNTFGVARIGDSGTDSDGFFTRLGTKFTLSLNDVDFQPGLSRFFHTKKILNLEA